MRLLKKDNDKETVALWKKEANRLERERNQLYDELEMIKSYKDNYDLLIREVSELKDKYTSIINKTEALGNEYKNKLQSIANKE